MKKNWQFWLGVLISALFMYWAFSKLEWDKFVNAVAAANYWWLLPGVGVYFVAVWIRA